MSACRRPALLPRRVLLLLPLVALAGCQFRGEHPPFSAEALPPPGFTDAPARCIAARARFGLGQSVSRPPLEEMRLRTGARRARSVLPTEPPLSYDAIRLLVDIDPNGRVVAARCG